MKCKNCDKETKGNNIYCSLKCRNIYVNKNLRDYSKNSNGLSKKHNYELNPNFCKNCGKKLEYDKRKNKFCNNSCSATYINSKRVLSKYTLSIEGRNNLVELAIKNFKINIELRKNRVNEYEIKPNFCKNCEQKLSYEKYIKNRIFCNRKCRTEFDRKNKTEYKKYKLDCKFNFSLKDFYEEFNFNLIKENGWYKAKNNGDNFGGVSRDHMFSISEGFKNKIDSKIISHPANCKLIKNSDNQIKNGKCSITIEELLERIEKWDLKYKNATLVFNG